MGHYEQILCRYCASGDLQKNGKNGRGEQRYKCKSCKRAFIRNYAYKACAPGVKEQIDKQVLNSSGMRDIARNLGINKNTVISHFKKKRQAE